MAALTAALAVLVGAGGAWLGAGETATPMATESVLVPLEPASLTAPAPAPPTDPIETAGPLDDDPVELAPWAPSVSLGLTFEPPAWRRFAVPAPLVAEGTPAIAILIDDMGVARAWSRRAVALPGPLTLAYLPHAPDLAAQAEAARRAGHELMLHMPMEPDDAAEDPGPAPLLTGLDEAELIRRAVAMLDSFSGYVGVNNHMGSRFTRDADAMRTVLAEVKARGLLFVDSRTAPGSTGERVARELDVPVVRRDIFIDDEDTEIAAQLAALEALARERGLAVAIAHPRPPTLDALEAWLPEAVARGVVLVPVSAAVARAQGIGLAAAREEGASDE